MKFTLVAAILASLVAVPCRSETVLALDAVLERVLEEHPDIASARKSVARSREAYADAWSEAWPHLNASLGADLWRRSPGQELEGFIPGTDDKPTTALSATWNLSPKTALRIQRASIEREIAEADYREATRNLQARVVRAYFNLYEAGEVLALQRELVRVQEEDFQVFSKKQQVGAVGPRRALASEESLLRDRLALVEAERSWTAALSELQLLLGQGLNSDVKMDVDPADPPDNSDASIWMKVAEQRRPDLAKALNRVESARKSVWIALWDRLPDLSLGFQYAFNPDPFYGQGSQSFRTQFLDNEAAWSFGIGINFPLFAGGSLSARHERARLGLEQARLAAALERRRVERDLTVALAGYDAARQALQIRRRMEEIKKEANEIISTLFKAGAQVQEVDAMRARAEWSRAGVDTLRARVRAREAWTNLLLAAGLRVTDPPPTGDLP